MHPYPNPKPIPRAHLQFPQMEGGHGTPVMRLDIICIQGESRVRILLGFPILACTTRSMWYQ